MRDVIHTDQAPAAIGPYVQGLRSEGWIFTAGQVGLDPATGQLVPGGVDEAAARALANLRAVLEAGGGGLDTVVKTTVFLVDMADFPAMNAVYAEAFGQSPPARSTVAVAALPVGARFEIEAVARRRD